MSIQRFCQRRTGKLKGHAHRTAPDCHRLTAAGHRVREVMNELVNGYVEAVERLQALTAG